MDNRIQHDSDGSLDEVVTNGGAHLEHMGGGDWFLECVRADGSAFAIWFTGKITLTEERDPGAWWAKNRTICPACNGEGSVAPADKPAANEPKE